MLSDNAKGGFDGGDTDAILVLDAVVQGLTRSRQVEGIALVLVKLNQTYFGLVLGRTIEGGDR